MSDTASAATPRAQARRCRHSQLAQGRRGPAHRPSLHHRRREVEIRALLTDLSLIADGGASFRFLVGRYGAGKSFLLQTIRTHAMGEGFVVADADLSPERRLQGGQGQGLATYRELIRNISTKTRPEAVRSTLSWIAGSPRVPMPMSLPSMPNWPRSRKWSTASTSPYAPPLPRGRIRGRRRSYEPRDQMDSWRVPHQE